ncbi:hypothetical protein KQX54_020764 [Cotesia glomerata]|uniref:Uncharacterized protein n=1 Tax=Cotesia glomerata TaxID=32391 RepID=A0AAV7I5C4_COTGL|nr:hypothetical protein KQX54_020764 [Cotesia glomerata]
MSINTRGFAPNRIYANGYWMYKLLSAGEEKNSDVQKEQDDEDEDEDELKGGKEQPEVNLFKGNERLSAMLDVKSSSFASEVSYHFVLRWTHKESFSQNSKKLCRMAPKRSELRRIIVVLRARLIQR